MELAYMVNSQIISLKELKEAQSSYYKEIIENINRFRCIFSALDNTSNGLNAIHELINQYATTSIDYYTFNRKIISSIESFLTSVRGYTDAFAHTLSQYYGGDSEIYKLFDSEKSVAYDSNESYRFVEAIRNYVQHRSFPECRVNVINSDVRKVTLIVNKQCLLADKRFPNSKIPSQYSATDDIDIIKHFDIMFGCLSLIHHKILMAAKNLLMIDEYYAIKQEYSQYAPSLCLFTSTDMGQKNKQFSILSFDFSVMDTIMETLEQEELFINGPKND